jgi:hypothetical protein
MKKASLVLVVFFLAATTYYAITASITQEARAIMASDAPGLNWLKTEYQLSEEQFSRIQALHEAQDAECMRLCRELSKSQAALREAIEKEKNAGTEFQARLDEWRQHRKRSQDSILKHMFEVSSEMDDEQARRYRQQVYENMILPGRTPHIDSSGHFDPEFIQQLNNH